MMKSVLLAAVLVLVFGSVFAGPASARNSDGRIEIPSWVFERCNRYPAFFVSSGGTMMVFYTKDETGICFAAVRLNENATGEIGEIWRQIERIKIVLARFDCWEIVPGLEPVVPGHSSPVIVARCEDGRSYRQFAIGYSNGIVFGYRVNW